MLLEFIVEPFKSFSAIFSPLPANALTESDPANECIPGRLVATLCPATLAVVLVLTYHVCN